MHTQQRTDERTPGTGAGGIRTVVGDLPAERLEAEIVTLAARLSAGTDELLVLVGELDDRGTWATWGALSCAGWLAAACDIEVSTARTQVRVARAMRAHPALDAAMRCGDVSYAKARVLVPHLTDANAVELVALAADAPAGALGARIAAWLQDRAHHPRQPLETLRPPQPRPMERTRPVMPTLQASGRSSRAMSFCGARTQ